MTDENATMISCLNKKKNCLKSGFTSTGFTHCLNTRLQFEQVEH